MNTTTTRATRGTRTLAASGVLALAAVSMLGAATAQAAPQDYGNIDTSRTGSLTVHKYLHQGAGGPTGDISEPTGGFSDPIAGVEFTAYPLLQGGSPLDLGQAASWDGLEGLSAGAGCTAPTGFTLGSPIVLPATDTSGESTVPLGVTAYQVCETDAPSNIVDTAAPFIVTVPMPQDNGWVYDVNAYPKNGAGEITKSIEAQEGLGLGAPVRFPVSSPIPRSETEWTAYSISDTVDTRLTPNSGTNGVSSVTLDGSPLDSSYYTATVSGQEIVMEFTPAGIAWLNGGDRSGSELVVTFDTTVNAVGSDGISNSASLWVNNPSRDAAVKPPLVAGDVNTNWGDLTLTKTVAGTSDTLEGATFQVYAAADPYAASCDAATATGSPIAVGGTTDFTTGADGTVAIPGLFVSDSVNPSIDATERCYVLRETAAPAGFVLPTGAEADTGVGVQIGNTTADNISIGNTQQGVPDLPLTGGAGTGALVGLGAILVLGAGGAALYRNRDKDAAQPAGTSA